MLLYTLHGDIYCPAVLHKSGPLTLDEVESVMKIKGRAYQISTKNLILPFAGKEDSGISLDHVSLNFAKFTGKPICDNWLSFLGGIAGGF